MKLRHLFKMYEKPVDARLAGLRDEQLISLAWRWHISDAWREAHPGIMRNMLIVYLDEYIKESEISTKTLESEIKAVTMKK